MRSPVLLLIVMFITCSCKKRNISTAEYRETDIRVTEEPAAVTDLDLSEAEVSIRTPEKEQLALIAEDLASLSLLSSAEVAKIRERNIQAPLILFKDIEHCKFICDSTFILVPPSHYLQLFDSLGALAGIKDFRVSSEFSERYDDIDDKTVQDIVIRLGVKGKEYTDTLIFFDSPEGRVNPDFYKSLNEIIAETGSPERIYMVRGYLQYELPDEIYYTEDPSCQAFLMLREEQVMFLRKWEDYLSISYEDHRPFYNREQIIRVLGDLESAGFPGAEEPTGLESVRSIDEILAQLSPITVQITDTAVYDEILRLLSQKSGHAFRPENIRIKKDGNLTEITFVHMGKKYSASYSEFNRDLPSVVGIVNDALNEGKVNGNFYLLDIPESYFAYIFLTEERINFLNTYKIQDPLNGR